MIFAQRPDATACADYDIRNKQMRRYVRGKNTGIVGGIDSRLYSN